MWCRGGERKLAAQQHGGMGVGEWERTLQEVREGGGGGKGCMHTPECGGLGVQVQCTGERGEGGCCRGVQAGGSGGRGLWAAQHGGLGAMGSCVAGAVGLEQ